MLPAQKTSSTEEHQALKNQIANMFQSNPDSAKPPHSSQSSFESNQFSFQETYRSNLPSLSEETVSLDPYLLNNVEHARDYVQKTNIQPIFEKLMLIMLRQQPKEPVTWLRDFFRLGATSELSDDSSMASNSRDSFPNAVNLSPKDNGSNLR